MPRHLKDLVVDLARLPSLQAQVVAVLESLPEDVRADFLEDETFYVSLERVCTQRKTHTFMSLPKGGTASRCVILREKLTRASEPFAQYVIAHELAHAFLRNGPWRQYTDREQAADALAEHWGYPKS